MSDPSQNNNPPQQPSIDDLQSQMSEGILPTLSLFNPYMSQTLKATEKLNTFHIPLIMDGCGFGEDPIDKTNIANRKNELGLRYYKQTQGRNVPGNNMEYDGLYTKGEAEKTDTLNLYRLEKRLVRDSRQEYYSESGELNLNKSFLDEKNSRLINISFENNPSLNIYQKNAILSMRDNQSKSEPFEFEIVLGKITLIKHHLKIEEERKFEELRPHLDWLKKYLEYPTLPHLSSIKQALEEKLMELTNEGASQQSIREGRQKLEQIKGKLDDESRSVEDKMKTILGIWEEIKGIRRSTQMIIVPWKLQVRTFSFEGRDQYQIGLNTAQTTSEGDVHDHQKERRAKIRKQEYYVRVIINGYEVTRSSKQTLQWPNFIVAFNEKLKINLYTKPSLAVLEIVQSGFIDTVIDRVKIKLPGEHANTLTSSERLLVYQEFSSNGDKVRRKVTDVSEEPSGFLSYRTEWKGTGSKMPPSRAVFADNEDLTTTADEDSLSSFDDPNDPRKIKEQKNKVKLSERDMSYEESKLPFADMVSTRHLLLKLREKFQLGSQVIIPLTQQAIRKRFDLLDLIKREKQLAVLEDEQDHKQLVYNPVDGFFQHQSKDTKERIKNILRKIPMNRHSSSGFVNTSKYKLVDEIINEYTFDQMVSPIVVFFKDIFTQRRKLGAKKTVTTQPRNNIIQFSFSLQANSGWNVPMRDDSGSLIMRYRQIRDQLIHRFAVQEVGIFSGITFFQQQPNFGANAFQYYNNGAGQMEYGVRGMDGQNHFPNQGNHQFMHQVDVDYNDVGNNGNSQDILANIKRVKPYIQFSYGRIVKRSREVQGNTPQWNEEIDIKFDCKKENINLEQIPFKTGKFLYITLFDMYQKSEPTNTTSIMKVKKTKYYLGNIQIPISTVITLPKLSGFFKVNRPLILLGYNTISQTLLGVHDPDSSYKSQDPQKPSHLSLNINVVPFIDCSFAYSNDRKFLIGEEKTELLQLASDWLDQLNIKRYVRLWMNNSDGQSVFITRFICDIQPPTLSSLEGTEASQKQIEKVARFVSLIPYKSHCKLLDNTEEFHLTLKQFLDVKMGDDHAFLLCSSFNAIDRKQRREIESFVVVGKAFPEGKTTYVMRRHKETKEFELWNPRTGDCYYLNEEASKHVCPLHEIGCLVSASNVFVNIQVKAHPFQISFDIQNPNHWKPFLTEQKLTQFFNGDIPSPYMSLPITQDTYEERFQRSEEIEESVYNYVKHMMETERMKLLRPHTFRIRNDLSNYVRDQLLMNLEIIKSEYRLTGFDSPLYSEQQKNRWSSVWDNIENTKSSIKNKVDTDRRIYGFPVNATFTTLEDIWSQISQSNIHLNERQDMEFVLAVRCFSYPCFLTSVWVFVGSIE